jgi:membrane-bound lytic murein transglycosylase MltF
MQTFREITRLSKALGIDTSWALAIAEQESSLGENQLSPTGAKGVFQMTRIAVLDLLQESQKMDDDMIDICFGLLFLRLLLKRHGSIEEATGHYCDPNDKDKYVPSVIKKMVKWDNP